MIHEQMTQQWTTCYHRWSTILVHCKLMRVGGRAQPPTIPLTLHVPAWSPPTKAFTREPLSQPQLWMGMSAQHSLRNSLVDEKKRSQTLYSCLYARQLQHIFTVALANLLQSRSTKRFEQSYGIESYLQRHRSRNIRRTSIFQTGATRTEGKHTSPCQRHPQGSPTLASKAAPA